MLPLSTHLFSYWTIPFKSKFMTVSFVKAKKDATLTEIIGVLERPPNVSLYGYVCFLAEGRSGAGCYI
jgi:hypothetical protein